MKRFGVYLGAAAGVLLVSVLAQAQQKVPAPGANGEEGEAQALVTILPSHPNEQRPNVTQQDIKVAKVSGKDSQVTAFRYLRGAQNPVELVLLIDADARTSLGTQMSDIQKFVQEMPPHTKMAIAYMINGVAQMATPLSSDPAEVLRGLHLTAGPAMVSASPYFCLSDLAKHWPSNDRSARREVVMISDGVDYYEMRYDPEDPYVHAAIDDSVRAGLTIYFLYWKTIGLADQFASAQDTGQNLMLMVTQATGGYSYWEGYGNPVDFGPYFKDIRWRLDNQYLVSLTAPTSDSRRYEHLQLKIQVPNAKVDAPQEVFVRPVSAMMR
ncbi:MAG: hypothetical protein ACLGP3_06320 [Acidobacteriota bacterium]